MDIKSAIVLITSASSILGSTLAVHFAHLGAKIILCDQDENGLMETFTRCHAISNDVHYYHTPDYSLDSINQLLDYINDTYQSAPDVLVNNWPNAPLPSLIGEQHAELFIQKLAMMASTLLIFGQVSAERMRQSNKHGVIVNVVSQNEEYDLSGIENANSMVSGFTQSWAKELTPFNIRVGGVVATSNSDLGEQIHWAEMQDELIRNTEYIVANEYFSGRVMSA
ncbi:SDR family oxidoreductase [Vibrio aestuarianus]|uniref:SDR family oxidoreductase n=1 Tax=Vibrio aestuarianus TaxID=28171 RepID=A0A9X4FBP4_9VIBR|nr:SDR family oxidoreductase [Vibrio aestuarianus]MDE1310598.1 SDR family oxidoreductase [Vibrio aestuarianus]MDE1355837.1 SDR family oxidoreductase [Vibrio aestuarianus]NGZ16029.1 SDR family oxidoreductase [Vibrio aestuarianus]NGZ91854.1 SDR family oxidoreductase [Vibrio aestuarianus subsp. cardii]